MKLEPPVPVLRIFDYKLARAFYIDWLGFKIAWEHHSEPEGLHWLAIYRDAANLYLTEHQGSPGAKVYIRTSDLEAFHRELQGRPHPNINPDIDVEPWGAKSCCVIDPFGNRIYFTGKIY